MLSSALRLIRHAIHVSSRTPYASLRAQSHHELIVDLPMRHLVGVQCLLWPAPRLQELRAAGSRNEKNKSLKME